MSSLKSFLYPLAPVIGMNPASLYERQRVLVRHGILRPLPGRGPGSGVELTAHNVAALLIACAAGPSLSMVDERIAEYCNAPALENTCPLTGKKTFRQALTAILEQKALTERVDFISVDHNTPDIFIEFAQGRKHPLSVFRWREGPSIVGIMSSSTIHAQALRTICYFLSREADFYERSS